MLVLDLTPTNAVRLEAGGRIAEIAYRRFAERPYLLLHEPETDLRLWAPIQAGCDFAMIVGLHSVHIHPVDLMPARARVGFEAARAVSISRIENNTRISA